MNQRHQQAIDAVSAAFGLPAPRAYSQNWESEVPEEFRTAERLAGYVSALVDDRWSDDARHLLMSLVLDVANDLSTAEGLSLRLWGPIDAELMRRDLYDDLVDKYCVAGASLADAYAITALVRSTARERRNATGH